MTTKRILPLAAVPLLLISLAACSPSGTSSDGSKTQASKTTGQDWDLAHAKCMRAAGFDVKDPGTGPGVVTVDGDMSRFREGQKTCTSQVEKKLGKRPVSEQEKRDEKKWIEDGNKQADCLRKQGYDVPDGTSGSTSDSAAIPDSAFEKCGAAAPQAPAELSK